MPSPPRIERGFGTRRLFIPERVREEEDEGRNPGRYRRATAPITKGGGLRP